jgi:hypothetical protein
MEPISAHSIAPPCRRKPRKTRAQKRTEAMLRGWQVAVRLVPAQPKPEPEVPAAAVAPVEEEPHQAWWREEWDPEVQCTICLGRLRPGRIHVLPGGSTLKTTPCRKLACGHKFHYPCLKTLARGYDPRCPLCRKPLDWAIVQALRRY